MATYTSSGFGRLASGGASDADFRAWGSACQSAIAGCGLTQVSSSTDWVNTTVPTVAATYNAGDVAIYKFNDGLSQDIFIKFEWGRGSITSGQVPYALRVTVGNNSSMSVSTSKNLYIGGMNSSTATNGNTWNACFIDGGFVLHEDDVSSSTTAAPMFVIERSRDSDGTPNANAVLLGAIGPTADATYTTTSAVRSWIYNRIIWPTSTISTTLTPTDIDASGLVKLWGTTDMASPITWGANQYVYALRSVMGMSTRVGALSSVAVSIGGVTKNYRTVRGSSSYMAATTRLAYRWD